MEMVPQGPEPHRHPAARTDRRGSPGHLRPQQVGAGLQGPAVHGAAGVHHRRAPHRLPGVDGAGTGGLRGREPSEQGAAAVGRGHGDSPEEAVEAVSLLLDNWRRSRNLHVTGDPIFSRYHAKDDPYIQAGLLQPAGFPSRRACCLRRARHDKYARGLIAQTGCLGGPGPRQEMGSPPQHARRGCGGDDALGVPDQRGQGAHARSTLRSQRENSPGRRVAGGPREVRRRAEPGQGALHHLPADHDPERSRTRPAPATTATARPSPSSPTRRTTTFG